MKSPTSQTRSSWASVAILAKVLVLGSSHQFIAIDHDMKVERHIPDSAQSALGYERSFKDSHLKKYKDGEMLLVLRIVTVVQKHCRSERS
jgi:hypothetical protein